MSNKGQFPCKVCKIEFVTFYKFVVKGLGGLGWKNRAGQGIENIKVFVLALLVCVSGVPSFFFECMYIFLFVCLSTFRSKSALGSSLKTEMSMPLEGVMSSDCTTNPDFCLWHMVDLLYCDGGSYLGSSCVFCMFFAATLYWFSVTVLRKKRNYCQFSL